MFTTASSGNAAAALEKYSWPGNIRELRNTIERAMLLSTHEWIEPDDFHLERPFTVTAQFRLPSEGVNMEDVERQPLLQALERSHGNESQAAQLLGLHRDQVRYRIEKCGLQV